MRAQATLRPRGTICIVSPPKDRAGWEAVSRPGLAAQDQAATSPDRAGEAGLKCLPSLLLPPAKCSCKNLLTPPAASVPEGRHKEKVLQREGLTKGVGMVCGVPEGPCFPHVPMHQRDPVQGTARRGWQASGKPLGNRRSSGILRGGSGTQHPGRAVAADSPVLFWEEQSLSSSYREASGFSLGLQESSAPNPAHVSAWVSSAGQ